MFASFAPLYFAACPPLRKTVLMATSVEDLHEQAAAKRESRLTAAMIAAGVLFAVAVCIVLLTS